MLQPGSLKATLKAACVISMSCVAICTPFVLYGGTRGMAKTRVRLDTGDVGRFPVVTLSFNKTHDQQLIEHNCAMMQRSGHEFLVYTDDLERAHCSVCTCIRFQRRGCDCPRPQDRTCGLCEKLHFVVERVGEFEEFVFLDSDLVILHGEFLDRLYRRSRDFDFLASYGFGNPCEMRYTAMFNSGLFFMRRLEGVNYSEMVDLMWSKGGNNDQNVISQFVRDQYLDWDVLSLKWHCRFLENLPKKGMRGPGIPIRDCYALHGRGSSFWRRLDEANRTLLRVGGAGSDEAA